MTNETQPANSGNHGDFERRDISAASVLYFLAGLAVAALIVIFIVRGLYRVLEKQTEAHEPPVSPLVTNAPKDTRHLSVDYRDYLKQNFPSPQLETDERTELDKVRINEEDTLNTYDWIDQSAGTVRIPIARAMDLIAQRGLPVRGAEAEMKPQAGSTKEKK